MKTLNNYLLLISFVLGGPQALARGGSQVDSATESKADKTYVEFVKSLFAVEDIQKSSVPLTYIGQDESGKRCQVSLSFSGFNKIGYSATQISVNIGAEDDAYSAILIQNDAVKMDVVDAQTTKYNSKSGACDEINDVEIKFASADLKTAANLSSIKTSVQENSCGAKKTFTLHQRSCLNLKKQTTVTSSLVAAATKLAKAGMDKEDARRLTSNTNRGCDMTPDSELVCSWDMSDDVDGDTGSILNIFFQVQGKQVTKILRQTTTDKYTGEESN